MIRTFTFPADYFAGADVAVYFGDRFVDEVAGLAFALQQQVQPVYGYGSYTYDAMLTGTRLVEGSFRIPFRQAGYLLAVAREASQQLPVDTKTLRQERADLPFRYAFEGHLTQQELLEVARRASPEALRSLVEQLRRQTWGEPSAVRLPRHQPLLPGGFTITVLYGAPPPAGLSEALGIAGVLPAGTVLRIEGVQLASVIQQIDPSGNPVFEDYSFLARDLVLTGVPA